MGAWSRWVGVALAVIGWHEGRGLVVTWHLWTNQKINQNRPNITTPVKLLWCVITGSIARSARRRYLIYSEADFEVFRPAGATRCIDGSEIWRGGDRVGQKRWVFVCLPVCLSITLLNVSLCARFRHEGVGVQKRFWCRWIGEGL